MTNITLSVEDNVYKRMKKHPDIKWSTFVRNAIAKRLDELDSLDNQLKKENILTMLASEHVLKKDWDNPQDERWNNV